MKRIRYAILVIFTAAATGIGLLAVAGSAAAAPAWHHRHHQLQPEQFDIVLADTFGGTHVNVLDAEGPVWIHEGTDATVSNNQDNFVADASDLVNVWHAPLGAPTIDLRTCSVSFTLTDAPWRFTGGTGRFLRATGSGVFDLQAMFSFSEFRGHCFLDRLSGPQISSLINSGGGSQGDMAGVNNQVASFCRHHHIPVPVLLMDDISVQGAGFASVHHHHGCGCSPKPTDTPTDTITPSTEPSTTAT